MRYRVAADGVLWIAGGHNSVDVDGRELIRHIVKSTLHVTPDTLRVRLICLIATRDATPYNMGRAIVCARTRKDMPYPAKAAANFFISKAGSNDFLTPMKLQKLLYFAQGWHLAVEDEPLFNEQIEAWQYGPVVPSVYRAFKSVGSGPIKEPAREYSLSGTRIIAAVPELPENARTIPQLVWNTYKNFSAAQLMALTHKAGTPWYQIYKDYDGNIPLGTDIPQTLIRDFFKKKLAE